MSKQDQKTRKLEKHLDYLVELYAQRVRASKNRKAGDGTVSDIFIELNNNWIKTCNLAKRPLQKEQFALAVTKLNKTTLAVEKRMKRDFRIGRFLFWFVAFMLLVGICVFVWSMYWLWMNHFQFFFSA